ncbi:MAG: hypothetical protein AAFN74_20090 [Myxococcota bacterium]
MLMPDTGVARDAGSMDVMSPDQGVGDGAIADSGIIEDSGVSEDAGVGEDTGALVDTGIMVDAGTADTGVVFDSGLPPDISCDEDFFANGGACGGNVAGTTWNFVNACGQADELQSFLTTSCPGSSVVMLDRVATGTLSFALGDQYTLQFDDQLKVEADIGDECTEARGSCPAVEDFIRQVDPDASCAIVPEDTCRCSFTLTLRVRNTGNYNAANNVISVLPMGGGLDRWAYCVSPDGVLRYQPQSAPSNPIGSTFVLQ